MDNVVPQGGASEPITVRHVDFRARTVKNPEPVPTAQLTEVIYNFKAYTIVVGANLETLRAVTNHLRATGRADPHPVLLDPSLDNGGWAAELQSKLEDIFSQSWRVKNASVFVARDGFSLEQFNAVLAGLRFVPQSVFVVSTGSTRDSASIHALERAKFGGLQWAGKRMVDVVLASLLCLFLAPLMLCICLLIKLDSPGPVLFRQRRRGFLGRPFDIFKFRTMLVLEDGDNVVQARLGDPRVTRIGRLLRRSSMDELPQLLNVLRGEMSLVGPRPHAEAHDRHYSAIVPRYSLRSYVKPGMTGWAQVHGYRGQIKNLDDIAKRIEFDGWYARNASVLLDLKILLRTISIVINQKNAY